MSNEQYQVILLGIQWYVIGCGKKIPVEDESSGILLIEELEKTRSDDGRL